MTLEDLRQTILKIPLCNKLPENMRDRFGMIFLWISTPKDVSHGDKIYSEGEEDENTGCLLIEGIIEVQRKGQPAVRLEAPELLGESGQFTLGHKRTATVEVVVGGRELSFSWRDFGQWAVQLYTHEERRVLKRLIAETAWDRSGKYLDYHPSEF